MRIRGSGAVVLTAAFLLTSVLLGHAEENAHYKLPSPDASFVDPPEMPRLLSPKLLPNRHGIQRGTTQGFMIRQSSVKDGMIQIPPGGLIYFTFGGEGFSNLNGEPIVIAGKEAIWLGKKEALAIRKDFIVAQGKPPVPLGEEGTIALRNTMYMDGFLKVQGAGFQFVFANGYGTWDLSTVIPSGYARSRNAIAYGYLQGDGMITPAPLQFFGDPFAASATFYVVVDSATPQGIKIKEAGALDMLSFKVSFDKPIIANDVAAGRILKAGAYRVEVLSVDSAAGTARIRLLDSKSSMLAEKTLGPLTLDTYKNQSHILEHSAIIWPNLMLDHENIRVQLNTKFDPPFGPGPMRLINDEGAFVPLAQAREVSTFNGGKVDLLIYENVKMMELRNRWSDDPRFILQTAYI
ncbi:MAG: hypothetical protein JXA73_18630 [Acidobacteria bacterium]|nr:hypothetical protein [Acidobacteriota bacterium]